MGHVKGEPSCRIKILPMNGHQSRLSELLQAGSHGDVRSEGERSAARIEVVAGLGFRPMGALERQAKVVDVMVFEATERMSQGESQR
jgi:hypothetical protein